MIQRIQSLYLFVVFILSVLLLTGPLSFIGTEDGGVFLSHAGLKTIAGEKIELTTWPITVFIVISIVMSFLSIFFYRKRQRQIRWSLFQMFFNLGLILIVIYYSNYTMRNFDGINYGFQWRMVIPPIMLVLLFLAFRAIRKDDLLVRAYDRIR